MQKKLRDELLWSGRDPTWEELTDHGSLLDAFTCEVLRIHPPFPELHRMVGNLTMHTLKMTQTPSTGRRRRHPPTEQAN
jgi:hypothetical protein